MNRVSFENLATPAEKRVSRELGGKPVRRAEKRGQMEVWFAAG